VIVEGAAGAAEARGVAGTVLRFHLRVGARLAMVAMVPAIAAAVGVAAFLRPDFLRDAARVLFGRRSQLDAAALVVGVALLVAGRVAPRVCAGVSGWLRHLPAAGATHRRAAAAAIAVAQLPPLVLLAGMIGLALASGAAPPGVAACRWAGLPVAALAAAVAALPVRRRWAAAPLALAGGLLAGLGSWAALLAALPLVALADLAAGPLRSPRAGVRPWFAERWMGRFALGARIAWRAVGWRRAAGAAALAVAPWVVTLLFVANNPLPPPYPTRAALPGGSVAMALVLAVLAGGLAVRRPVWPWARSLPWSAARRILDDAVLLGAAALVVVAFGAWLAPAAAAPLAGTAPLVAIVPLLALRAAAAIRRPAASRLGAAGELLPQALLLGGVVTLLPWIVVPLAAALPWAWRAAARRERDQKASLWLARHHLAAGDSHSWTGS
jgi:hypothetical protein